MNLRPPGYEPPQSFTRVPPYSAEMQTPGQIRPQPLHLGGTQLHRSGSPMLAERLQPESLLCPGSAPARPGAQRLRSPMVLTAPRAGRSASRTGCAGSCRRDRDREPAGKRWAVSVLPSGARSRRGVPDSWVAGGTGERPPGRSNQHHHRQLRVVTSMRDWSTSRCSSLCLL